MRNVVQMCLTHPWDCASIMVKDEKNEISFAKERAKAGDIC
jgi:hypothetical protein